MSDRTLTPDTYARRIAAAERRATRRILVRVVLALAIAATITVACIHASHPHPHSVPAKVAS